MKNPIVNSLTSNTKYQSKNWLIICAAILILTIPVSCDTKREKEGSYLDEALQKTPDAYFERAFVGPQDDGTYIVATSQRIDPAGENITFPGRPVDLALNQDESILAIKNINNIIFIDTKTHEINQSLALLKGGNTFTGIAWSDEGRRVWTTDTRGILRSAKKQEDGNFVWATEILMPGPDDKDKNGA